jgi:3-methyladenine DNA glycosylase AlkD
MRVIGTAVPSARVVVRDVSKRVNNEPADAVLSLAEALVAAGIFEVRHAGYEVLSKHRAAMASLRTRDVERLGKGVDNWASVDTFATMVAGPAWREGRVTDAAVLRWAGSEDRWWRRTAVVVTVALNQKARGGGGDTPRTLMMCDRLVADRDDMVVKGLSWALRELSVRDRKSVEGFLHCHGDGVAPRVRREVGNKLRSGLKNPKTQ